MNAKIPISKVSYVGNEKKYAFDAINSSWISSNGKYIHKFEELFSKLNKIKYSLGVINGTKAIELALLALNIQKNDEVIVPSFTFIASVNPIVLLGGRPVFVDIDPKTLCIDPNQVKNKITKKTKGIIAVHLYGHPCDMIELKKIANKNKLWIIEDCAEAHFSKINDKFVGMFGDIATFSFFGNKIITCGEGGAVNTNNKFLYKKLKLIRGQGMSDKRRYYFNHLGSNYRLSNICSSILLAQLEKYQSIIHKRKKIKRIYSDYFKSNKYLKLKFEADNVKVSDWLISIIIINKKVNRNKLLDFLSKNGVETRPFFPPVHKMKHLKRFIKKDSSLKYTNKISKIGFNLPIYNDMTKKDVIFICRLIGEYLSEFDL